MDFKLPEIGEGIVEGEIVQWLVEVGEEVREDQPIVEVMTDKASVEISSPTAGVIERILWQPGDVVPVGETLVVIAERGVVASAGAPAQEELATTNATNRNVASPADPPEALSHDDTRTILAAPATRALARKLGVDITRVRGSGPRGRVTKGDVQRCAEAVESGTTTTHASASVPPFPSVESRDVITRRPKPPAVVHTSLGALARREQRRPLVGLRRLIARQMELSTRTAAHFTYVEEVDVTALRGLRGAAKEYGAARGVRVTFLPFIVKATVAALKEFPFLNASLDEETAEIVLKSYYDIGIAVQTDAGLVVPVVRDCDQKSVLQIAREIEDLSARTRARQARPEELKGSTFTITSLGKLGGVLATPVINYPEVAILGVHAIKERAVVRDGEVVVAPMVNLSCSLDHRVVDGYVGAEFVQHIRRLLEDPKLLVIEVA